jgi:hypothetical protein
MASAGGAGLVRRYDGGFGSAVKCTPGMAEA